MENASQALDSGGDADTDPGENIDGLCPLALVEAFETLEAAERGLRAAKLARNQLSQRLQCEREILPVSRHIGSCTVSSSNSVSDEGSTCSASKQVSVASVETSSCLPTRWSIRRRMKQKLSKLSRRSSRSSSSSSLSKTPLNPGQSRIELLTESVSDYEEYKVCLAEVDAWRSKVIQSIRLVEELKGSVRRSILANMDPEEAARYQRLRQGLLAAAIVDLWVYDSERLRGKLAVSVLDHPADVFSAIASDIDLLADIEEDTEATRSLAVAYRTLAVLSRLTLPHCPCQHETGVESPTCSHAVQFITPLVDPFEAIVEAYWDQRFLYQPLLDRLQPHWDTLVKGSERYHDLIDLCQAEPICFLSEEAKRRKFHTRIRKWQTVKKAKAEADIAEAAAKEAAQAEAAARAEAPSNEAAANTDEKKATRPALERKRRSSSACIKRRCRSPSLLLHISVTPDGLEA